MDGSNWMETHRNDCKFIIMDIDCNVYAKSKTKTKWQEIWIHFIFLRSPHCRRSFHRHFNSSHAARSKREKNEFWLSNWCGNHHMNTNFSSIFAYAFLYHHFISFRLSIFNLFSLIKKTHLNFFFHEKTN